jgi:hypothetical protein
MLIFGDPAGQFYSTTAQAAAGYYQSLSATIHTSGLPSGNVGPTALQMGPNGARITVPSSAGPYFLGFRLCSTSAYSSQELCQFADPSGNEQVSFWTNSNGTISVYRPNSGGVLLGTSSVAVTLAQNTWDYVECSASIDASAGTIGIRINGISGLSLTGQNTKGSGSSSLIGRLGLGSNLLPYFQDIYITDSTGSHNIGFLGDVSLSVYNPTGTGTAGLNQFTPNGAATIWQSTDAVTPTDSTIFASDATPGDRMSNTLAQTSVTGTIAGLVHVSRVKKDASGTRTFAQTITSNGTDAIGATKAPGTSYAYFSQVSEYDVNTGLPWTQAGVNAIQCGLETVA